MNFKRNNDNIYKTGTVITAKENPQRKLVIMKYIHRTYYCAVVGDAEVSHLTYFEKELIPPSTDQQKEMT